MTREPIYLALFNKLNAIKTAGTVGVCSRRLVHWKDADISSPCIYMSQGRQLGEHQLKGSPYKWDLEVNLFVYVNVPDGSDPAPVINPILDAIEASISPLLAGTTQTLGGLCDSVYIDGAIETFEGTLGEIEVAIVPLKILVR